MNPTREGPNRRKLLNTLARSLALAALLAFGCSKALYGDGFQWPNTGSAAFYTNIVDRSGPWSIHVVRMPRRKGFEIRSAHADGRAIGLDSLSQIIGREEGGDGKAIAGINGDFFQRDGAHAGTPGDCRLPKAKY